MDAVQRPSPSSSHFFPVKPHHDEAPHGASRTHVFKLNFLALITTIPQHQPFRINLFPNCLQLHSLIAQYVEDLTDSSNYQGIPRSQRSFSIPWCRKRTHIPPSRSETSHPHGSPVPPRSSPRCLAALSRIPPAGQGGGERQAAQLRNPPDCFDISALALRNRGATRFGRRHLHCISGLLRRSLSLPL